MKKLLLTSALVLAMSTPAMAQDYNDGYDDPLTGVYAGVQGGYSWIDADGATDYDVDGEEYGVFVGFQVDEWLQDTVGLTGAVEAHYEWSNADDTVGGVEAEKNSRRGT